MKKRLLALTLAFAMCLAFAACGEKRDSPETVVSNGIDAVKSLDQKALAAYWDVESFDDLSGSDDSEETTQLMTLLVKNLSYKITSSEEKDSTATVSVEFTNLDMKSVMADVVSEAFSKMLEYVFLPEDQQPTEEETDAMFMEILTQLMDDNEYETVTASVNMELTLKDDKWKISATDDVLDAMFGGFVSYSDEMDSDTGSDDAVSQIGDARNWLVGDVWNDGICDMSHYYENGKNSLGQTMDPDFTLSQLGKTMSEKNEYNDMMNKLPDEYAEITDLWNKIMEQVDMLYAEIQSRGTEVTGSGLDTGLYQQYFSAFDDMYYELS